MQSATARRRSRSSSQARTSPNTSTEQLARIPDLSEALREATPAIKRQVFAGFDLQIAYDKVERRVELSATVSEAVADAFENRESPPSGGPQRRTDRHSGGPIRLSLRRTNSRASTPTGLIAEARFSSL